MQTKFLAVLAICFLCGCGNRSFLVDDGDLGLNPESEPHQSFDKLICSKLNFDGMEWSQDLSSMRKQALTLALNISGSFEGDDGWANLSNDFDGQGMSIGLLSQNLGQGTLQPLLVEMRDKFKNIYDVSFNPPRLESLLAMLKKWEGFSVPVFIESLARAPGKAEQDSILWARGNLYVKGDFIPAWKKELETFSTSVPYTNLQLRAAMVYDSMAMDYMSQLKLSQVRSYLVMFDTVVQNGGLLKTHLQQYWNWLIKNSKANETEKLRQIILIRRNDVLPRWRGNYLMRKVALANRKGVVNGVRRNFEKEYCFDGLDVLIDQTLVQK